jgi:NADH-quinone oxidoreductase subunit J
MVTLFAALAKTAGAGEATTLPNPSIGLVKELGRTLFTDFLLPFEIISILLLSAMVGAVLLAKKEIN